MQTIKKYFRPKVVWQKIFIWLMLLPFVVQAHPGIGIVKDSKGNIYYTDLQQVWKMHGGRKQIVVANVHTHELFVDKNDNLYGQNEEYHATTNKFYHYLWVYSASGKLDTLIKKREAYVRHDFSLARDKNGNEYYTKQFLALADTNHIYRKSTKGVETVFATGNFKGVRWLHPQENGTLLYVKNNELYMADSLGTTQLLHKGIGSTKPSFKFSGNSVTIWGVWPDNHNNIYIAVFSDQLIKKIDANGKVSVVHQSKGEWAPLHGVFEDAHHLWVLESSDKNEVRVTLVETNSLSMTGTTSRLSPYSLIGLFTLAMLFVYVGHRSFTFNG